MTHEISSRLSASNIPEILVDGQIGRTRLYIRLVIQFGTSAPGYDQNVQNDDSAPMYVKKFSLFNGSCLTSITHDISDCTQSL